MRGSDEIVIQGSRYVSAARAAKESGFVRDYIARLCRQGVVRGQQIDSAWYVDPKSLQQFLSDRKDHQDRRNEELRRASRALLDQKTSPNQNNLSAPALHALTLPSPELIAHVRKARSADQRARIAKQVGVSCLLVLLIATDYALFNPVFAEKVHNDIASASAIARDAPAAISNFDRSPRRNAGALSASAATGAAGLLRAIASWLDPLAANSPALTYLRGNAISTTTSSAIAPATDTIVHRTVTEPVIERVAEAPAVATPAPLTDATFVTQGELQSNVSALGNSLRQLIYQNESAPNSLPATGGYSNEIAASQVIDNLDGTTISGPTVTGGSISGANISGGSVTATAFSGTLPVSNGGTGFATAPSYGQLLLGNSSGGYSLVSTSSLGIAGDGGSGSSNVSTSSVNTWSDLQIFAGSASSSQLSVFTNAYFGGSATSSFNSSGQLTLASLSNALLSTEANGHVVATTSIGTNLLNGAVGVSNGGTASTTLGGLLSGNGTGALTSANVSSPLLFSSNTLSIQEANATEAGYLSSADWSSFNNKISSSSLSTFFPLAYNPETGVFSSAFGTTTANTFSSLQIFNGGASTTNVTATGEGYFGAASTTNLTISDAPSGFLQTNASGLVSATSTFSAASIFGTLGVGNGGTGSTTLTGLLKGNGTSQVAAAVPGIDYVAPATTIIAGAGLSGGGDLSINRTISLDLTHANSWSALQLFSAGASTTDFSTFGNAYFGGTATSSFNSAGALTLATPLATGSGGTGIGSVAAAGVLLGNYAGTGYQQIATSSLGLTTSNVAEGSNLYYTANRVASVIAGTTTDALAEGSANLYFTNARADARINATSTIGTLTSAPNLGTISTSLSGFLKADSGVLSTSLVNLSSDITGILPVGNGGTGWPNIAAGAVVLGNGSSGLSTTTRANLTETGSSILTITGGTNALLGSGTTIQVAQASGSQSGYLASSDWTTFNTKAGTASPTFTGTANFANASTTNISASGTGYFATASTTNLTVAGFPSSILSTGVSGVVSALSIDPSLSFSGNMLAFNLTNANNWTGPQSFSNATSSQLSAYTAYFGGSATSSFNSAGALTLAGLTNSLLYANGSNQVAAANATYPLQFSSGALSLAFGTTTSNTFSNLQTFTFGFLSNSSSTIVGNLNTTGTSYFGSNVGIGTTTPGSVLSINSVANLAAATSTFYSTGGINLTAGCFAVSGTCLSTSGGGVSLSAANVWGALQTFSANSTSTELSAYSAYFGGSATSSFSTTGALTLATQLTVPNGGTGQTSLTGGQLLFGNGTGAVGSVATSSATCGTGISCTTFPVIGSTNPSFALAAIAGNSVLANIGNGSAAPTALATSSLFDIAASGVTGLLSGTDWTTFNNKAGTASPTFTGTANFANASSTNFSVFSNAYFGGSATSSFNSAGALTLATALTVPNGGSGAGTLTGLLQGNGTGAITGVTGTAGQFAYFNGTNTILATSTLFLAASGNMGIGTTSPTTALTIQAPTNTTPFVIASSTGATMLSVDTTGALSAKLKQLTADYKVDSGSASINVGDLVSYINGNATKAGSYAGDTTIVVGTSAAESSSDSLESAAALDATHFVMAYKNGNTNEYMAVIGTISVSGTGTTIAYGTPVNLSADDGQYISVAALSSTSFVVAYDDNVSDYAYAVVSTISGTTITRGTPVALNALSSSYESVAALSSTSFVVAYDNGSEATAVVSTVSGTTITEGTPVNLNAVTSTYESVAALSSTSFVVAYEASSDATAVVSTVSGTTITKGTPVNLNAVTSTYESVAALSSTSFVVAYEASSEATAVVSTVSGTTITGGTPVALNAVTSVAESVADLSSTSFVVAYQASSVTNAVVSTVSGTIITGGTPVAMNAVNSGGSVAALSSTSFVVAYAGASSNATAVTGTVVTANILGMATNAASANGTVTVASSGIVTGLTGLTAGSTYYYSYTGGLSSSVSTYKVGIALSSSSMLLDSGNGAGSDQFFGDAIFNNDFRITEAPGHPEGLIFESQLGRDIATLDEDGNWAILGTLTSQSIASTTLQGLLATSTVDTSGYDFVGNLMDTIASRLTTLTDIYPASTTSPTFSTSTTSPKSALATPIDAYATTFVQSLVSQLTQWFADTSNGIDHFFANVGNFHTVISDTDNTQILCLSAGPSDQSPICITKARLAALLSQSAVDPTHSSPATSTGGAVDTPPIIQISGDNPAMIQVGDSYNDLGATIAGPQADLNLSITTYVDGIEMSPVKIDTTQAATDTVDYVATDQSGLTSTSTRTVIIETASPVAPTDNASTTAGTNNATSTVQ
jgi:hypothetical protein